LRANPTQRQYRFAFCVLFSAPSLAILVHGGFLLFRQPDLSISVTHSGRLCMWGCAMAGFGRNGSRSSAKAVTNAERHREWIELRRQGVLESEIASRHGVTQQAISKAILKHVRNLPAAEADCLRETQLALIDSMREMAVQAYEQAAATRHAWERSIRW
jgi:hypothetical protein